MKIIFQDNAGTVLREEIISEAEHDAMATDMLDVTEWITNAFRNKSRQCVDYIVEQSGRGERYPEIPIRQDRPCPRIAYNQRLRDRDLRDSLLFRRDVYTLRAGCDLHRLCVGGI